MAAEASEARRTMRAGWVIDVLVIVEAFGDDDADARRAEDVKDMDCGVNLALPTRGARGVEYGWEGDDEEMVSGVSGNRETLPLAPRV